MRLQELFETTEEDRALISLSSSVYDRLEPYFNVDLDYTDEDEETVDIGKIGDLFDTPISVLNNVSVELQGGEPFIRRAKNIGATDSMELSDKIILGIWDDTTRSIVINSDYLDSNRMRTTITHELRHALDEYKSNSYPPSPKNKNPDVINRYFTPKKKEHRSASHDSNISYRAQPAEINARFAEVLDTLATRIIPRAIKSSPAQARSTITHDLNHLLTKYEIADLFPERTESRDYKRLIKRAVDFIDKELAHNGVFYPKTKPNLG